MGGAGLRQGRLSLTGERLDHPVGWCGACRMIEDKPHLRRILQSILQHQSIYSYGILDNAVG